MASGAETGLLVPTAPRPLTARSSKSTNSSCTSTSCSDIRRGKCDVQSTGASSRPSKSHSSGGSTTSRSLRPGTTNAAVPGYAGHVPGAKVENIIGARFAEVNSFAAFNDPKRSPRRDGHTSSRSQGYNNSSRPETAQCRHIPGYTGWVHSKRTEPGNVGRGFSATTHAADRARAALSARDPPCRSGPMQHSVSDPGLRNNRSLASSRASSAASIQSSARSSAHRVPESRTAGRCLASSRASSAASVQSSARSSAQKVPHSRRAGEQTQHETIPPKPKSNGLHRFFKNDFARICTSSFRPAFSPPDSMLRPEWRN